MLNDAHGHSCGDRVLQTFAEICQRTLRQTDVIARSGGEEFTFLMPFSSDVEMHRIADRVRSSLADTSIMTQAGIAVRATVSLGVTSTAGRRGITWDQLLLEADAALYEAKRAGRDRTLSSRAALEANALTDNMVDVLPTA